MTRKNIFIFIALIIFSSLNACAHPAFYRAAEIKGQVVDTETKEPIEGVAVVAQWILYGNGSHNKVLKVYEAVTDSNGSYHIPAWGPKLKPGLYYLDNYDPQISFFKKGYKYVRVINSDPKEFYKYYKSIDFDKVGFEEFNRKILATSFEYDRSLRESLWDGRTVELNKFEGSDEDLDRMLSDIYIEVLGNEEAGVPIKKVKYMAREWSEALKEVKKPFLYKTPPPHIQKMFEEEFK